MKIFIFLLALFCFALALLGYNFFSKCTVYGGDFGKIKQCTCYGAEVASPAEKLGIDEGFSSTMCVGLQFNQPEISLPTSANPKCNEKIVTGSCLAVIPAFEYNAVNNQCSQGVWGGCGGNVPFKTELECVNTCVQKTPK